MGRPRGTVESKPLPQIQPYPAALSSPGVLILGITREPLYVTPSAHKFLAELNSLTDTPWGNTALPLAIQQVCSQLQHDEKRDPAGTDWDKMQAHHLARTAHGAILIRGYGIVDHRSAQTGRFLILLDAVPAETSLSGTDEATDYRFTERQRSILDGLDRGLTNKEIAANIHISIHTVKEHIRQLMNKLHTTSRTGIVGQIAPRFTETGRPPHSAGLASYCSESVNPVAPARRPLLRFAAVIGAGATLIQTLASIEPLFAGLFACTEGPGITVITDSPTQLSQCRPLNENSSATREERPHRSAPATESVPLPPNLVEQPMLTSQAKEQTLRPTSISIPLERLGSLFVVTIHVNETRSARVILDTGASHTILSHAIARDLGLYSHRLPTSVTMSTVGGSVQADMVRVDSIRIAGAEVRNSMAAIYDLPDAAPDIEGLLGLSVLRQFEVTLDTARSRLHLGLPQP